VTARPRLYRSFPANLTPIPAPSRANFMTSSSDEVPQHDSQGGFRAAHISEIQFGAFLSIAARARSVELSQRRDQRERYLLRTWLPRAISGPKLIFFDVGANVGHYSEMMLECFPTAFVHAFEPHPRNYSHLLQHAFPADRAKCHNIALGQCSGSMTLYDHADNDGSEHASLHEATITEFHEHSAVGRTCAWKHWMTLQRRKVSSISTS